MLTPSQLYSEMHASPTSITTDVSRPSQNLQQPQPQLEDPAIRNARIRLDYKKSFEDDLLFFPEPRLPESSYRSYDQQIPVDMVGYVSPDNFSFTSNNLNSQTFFPQKQNQHSHQQQLQKENLLSLLAFKNLEKQQQQQEHPQQHRYLQNQTGSQPYQIRRGGQTFYPQTHQNQHHHHQNQQQQKQQQHYGEPYSVNQNVFNYANLRARG